MHRRLFSSKIYRTIPFLDNYFRAHAVLHHTKYYRIFNFEPDHVGREIDMRLGLFTAIRLYAATFPLVLALAIIDLQGAVEFTLVAFLHMYLWGLLHHEMHVPKNSLIQQSRAFRFLARYHFLHHRYPRRNYNVIIPIADILMGTFAEARSCDLREMLRLGYLSPRRSKTQDSLSRHVRLIRLPAARVMHSEQPSKGISRPGQNCGTSITISSSNDD